MTQSPRDESATALIDALDALVAGDTASLATEESAAAVVDALDALFAVGAAARQRPGDREEAFASRIQHVAALRDALDAADGEVGGGFRDLIDALNARIDRLDTLRDAMRRAEDTQVEVGNRLRSLRSKFADSGS